MPRLPPRSRRARRDVGTFPAALRDRGRDHSSPASIPPGAPLARVTIAPDAEDVPSGAATGAASPPDSPAPLVRVLTAPAPLTASELLAPARARGWTPTLNRAIITAKSTRNAASVMTAKGNAPESGWAL